jgi:hypothetical protein
VDSFQIGAVIGVFALMILAIFILPIAYRHDRRRARRDRDGDAVVASSAVFGGDGGAGCSDGGGSC